MNKLPLEILEQILCHKHLNEYDLINLSSTCSELRASVTGSNAIWKQKFFQRWISPRARDIIKVDSWYEEFVFRRKIEMKTKEIILEMSPKFYSIEEVSDADLAYVDEYVTSGPNAYVYMVDYLRGLSCLTSQKSMTMSYYAHRLLRYIKKNHLTQKWMEMQELPKTLQTLEKGAVFVANWFQVNDENVENMVTEHLDHVANMVRSHLRDQYKDHPANSVMERTFLSLRNENLENNLFQPDECKKIINFVNHVVFVELQYYSISDVWAEELSFTIDTAIFERKTTPLILAVIYESIARRVGIRCEVILFPAHCLIRWKEDYSQETSPYHYIDMSGSDIFLRKECCNRSNQPVSRCQSKKISLLSCNMQKVAKRTAQDLLRVDQIDKGIKCSDVAIMELLIMFSPRSIGLYRQLGRYYMRKKMDLADLIKKITSIPPSTLSGEARQMYHPVLRNFQLYERNLSLGKLNIERPPKTRTSNLEFAVGMIVRHKIYQYSCVIYGWDPYCKASQSWIEVNGIFNLVLKNHQPFYNVLADDGSEHYVAQENLRFNNFPPLIFHPEVGHYFDEYCTTHYKGNQELLEEYPEDAAALEEILLKRIPG